MKRMLIWLLLFSALAIKANAQSNNVATGIVKNENGDPLQGTTVHLKNTSNGFNQATVTNAKGIFSFSKVPSGTGYQFIISSIGYQTDTLTDYEMKENGRISISVTAHTKNTNLDKVVVIGYGTMKKKDLSAAVAEVPDLAQTKERPVVDVANMMQGRVAGVTVVSDGGHPDQPASVVIRGVGSRNGESVLYVVDGVPNAPYNPSDVESITILKDAASAAIYGAFSGSAGVVLITTKQASKGTPSVEYTGFMGAKNAWRLPQSLTAPELAKEANLAAANAGQQPLDGWDATKNPYDQVTRTDWVHSIFRTGIVQRHTLTLNAGTEKFSTLFSGRYEENQGTLLNTYSKNISARFNAGYQFNSHIKFKQDIFLNNSDSRGTETESGYSGTILSAIYMPRSATVYYDDGTFGGTGPIGSQYNGIHGDAINPVATLLRNQPYNKGLDVQSISELKVSSIIRGLSFTSRFSYRQGQGLYKNFQVKRTEPGKPNAQNILSYRTDKSYSWFWENTLNYSRNFGRHSIGAMVSTTANESSVKEFTATAGNFDNEATWAQFFVNAGDFVNYQSTDYDWKDRNLSYVGRISYSWADRYFVTGSYRQDIADRLPPGHRAKTFPGLTAAWKISSEPFFHVAAIDLLKIRASWGRIGNINSVPLYYGYQTLRPDATNQVGFGGPTTRAYYVNAAINNKLSWESSEQKDLGMDIGVLKDKLSITIDYFDKLTYDLITPQTNNWPNTYGINAPLINQGKIRNTGIEFSATWNGNVGKLGYQIGGNFATLKNRVDYIDGNPTSQWFDGSTWRGTLAPYRSQVGQPYLSYYLIKTAGIFQSASQVQSYTGGQSGGLIQKNARPGDLKFVDQNKDGKINDQDRVYMGNAFPKFTYGFTANLNWKHFDMSMFWQGVSGVKLFHAFKESTLNGSEQGYNRWDKILGAWSPTNTKSNIPIISANDPNNNFLTPSDWYLESGDYLRLKSLIIGYNFPKVIRNVNLRIYVSGDNLITITKYSGMDPEVGGMGFDGGQFPVSRAFAAGIKLTF